MNTFDPYFKRVMMNMGPIRVPVKIIFALIISLSMFSCKNQKSSERTEMEKPDIVIADQKDEFIEEIYDYPLPTSFEVTKLLVEAGASYILDLCNDVDNVDRYMDLKSKALNLGVYGADLSYAATYNQTQETMQYLNASAKLIDELQIESNFNENLVQRVDANLDNVDSLIIIISDSFFNTYKYLARNEQDDLSILVMAGSWIEALYITTQMAIISADNEKITDIIAEQNTSLEKLLEIMEPIRNDEMGADVYSGLEEIHELYKRVDGQITADQLEEFIRLSETLRTQIVT